METQLRSAAGATGLVAVINLDTLEGWIQFASTVAAFLWWLNLWWQRRKGIPPSAPSVAALAFILLASGCARYSSRQIDMSRYDGTNELRQVETHAGGYTLFSGKNNLAKWKATQTDKSQTAGIEGLSQESKFAEEFNALATLLDKIKSLQTPPASAVK